MRAASACRGGDQDVATPAEEAILARFGDPVRALRRGGWLGQQRTELGGAHGNGSINRPNFTQGIEVVLPLQRQKQLAFRRISLD